MSEHPSRDELAALHGGGLSPAREREVLRHLLLPCENCLATAPPPLALLLGSEPARQRLTVAEEKGYDAAIRRAFKTVLEHERHLRSEKAKARKIVAALKEKGWKAVDTIHRAVGPLARMIAFLDWSWQLRHENPQQMVQFAKYAALVSQKLDVGRYGLDRVFDFQARAYAELGNAYRVQDQLQNAAATLSHARALFERGTHDKGLEVRLLELEASLAADYRQFGRASQKLLTVFRFYNRQNDRHFAGRTLILMGLYSGYAGNLEKGVRLLKRGLALIDEETDPGLACAAAHNLVLFLVDSENFKEAKKLRLVHARHLADAHGEVNAVKFRALDGRIDAGLGNHARAEAIFLEVQQGYEQFGRHYHAAITALDLAVSLLPQGKAAEAASVVLKASETFTKLGIQREGLQAIILLREAFIQQTATMEMVNEVARFLERLTIDPDLRFEGRAWEGFDPDPDPFPS